MLGPQVVRKPVPANNPYGHSRTRTVSSNNPQLAQNQGYSPQHLSQPQAAYGHSRRSPSVNTFSTSSSIPPPAAYRKSSASDLHRSESNRSAGTSTTTNSGSGYVALLRKQKATVWCDRAQYEDPRLVAQQRAAKKRANLEVTGTGRPGYGGPGSRTSTGITATGKVAAKIRHHGKGTPVVGLTPGENHVGVGGVPLRLSATEVEAESSDEEKQPVSRLHHRRTGSSGRSSIASGARGIPYRTSGGQGSLHSLRRSPGDTPERSGSIVEDPTGEAMSAAQDDSVSTKARSTMSGSSGERADNVGELTNAPRLASNSLMHSALTREKSVKNPEELKRRGSVDERTTTFTSQRLYIANPD